MSDLSEKLDSIYKKTEKLVQLNKNLVLENNRLIEEKEKSLSVINDNKQKISNLEEERKIIAITKEILNQNPDSHDIKIKINEYIREIDKCISLLND